MVLVQVFSYQIFEYVYNFVGDFVRIHLIILRFLHIRLQRSKEKSKNIESGAFFHSIDKSSIGKSNILIFIL